MIRTGIAGASGFTGAELLRLASAHPQLSVDVVGAAGHAGSRVAEIYPSLAAAYRDLVFRELAPGDLAGFDLVFLALPHGASETFARELAGKVGALVDLSADFRLRDPVAYQEWYGREHGCPELIGSFAYGLPELFRDDLQGADLIACPGCYPTAAALALAPFVRAGVLGTGGVLVDAASGVSGAGSGLARATQFAVVDGDFKAYGLLEHRHTPEMEQAIGAEVLFTPHLAPMTRGILATCYARPVTDIDTDGALALLSEAYEAEPFVVVGAEPPSTKATLGSNCAQLTARVDTRTGWLVSICAIDNLMKGASGQAMQCANLALGLPEITGLPLVGVYP